ncbi:hypothetical protein LTR94_030503, partial [Friedmanniomyces endolithicus]
MAGIGDVERDMQRGVGSQYLRRRPVRQRVPQHHAGAVGIARRRVARIGFPFGRASASGTFVAPKTQDIYDGRAAKGSCEVRADDMGFHLGCAEPKRRGRPGAYQIVGFERLVARLAVGKALAPAIEQITRSAADDREGQTCQSGKILNRRRGLVPFGAAEIGMEGKATFTG